MPMTENKASVLELKHIAKRFGSTQALDDVSLSLLPGEIHALLGENGAGKSTLIKIMTGVYQPDHGEILLDGRPIKISSSVEAQEHGIAAIYQEPMVFPDLNVAENIFITHSNRGFVVGWGKMIREAEEILATLDVKLDVRQPARGLTVAAQQTVEIAKAISLKTRVLIMDEPTAALSAHEVALLFKLAANLREQGVAILFISHRMEEVFQIADRVTVFRDGRLISSAPRREVTPESAIRDMVGRKIEDFFAKSQSRRDEVLMSVRGLSKENVSRTSVSTFSAARCWALPGWWAPGAPMSAWLCSGSNPPTWGRLCSEASPKRFVPRNRRCNWASPTSPKTAANWG
jgi:rhamnose transport system ATP-binding protein